MTNISLVKSYIKDLLENDTDLSNAGVTISYEFSEIDINDAASEIPVVIIYTPNASYSYPVGIDEKYSASSKAHLVTQPFEFFCITASSESNEDNLHKALEVAEDVWTCLAKNRKNLVASGVMDIHSFSMRTVANPDTTFMSANVVVRVLVDYIKDWSG